MTASRFKKPEIVKLWRTLNEKSNSTSMDRYQFRSVFDNMKYTGNSSVRNIKSAPVGARATIVS